MNRILKQYLCCSMNYQQEDWEEFIPLAKFVYNNNIYSLIKQTPLFANHGHDPKKNCRRFEIKHT